tara:strand:- start:190 stop:492 length:303 start_codon:yes stop_codon:yes gene_type:complete
MKFNRSLSPKAVRLILDQLAISCAKSKPIRKSYPDMEWHQLEWHQLAQTKKIVHNFASLRYSSICHGGIAQLGERLHGMQEVSGSIPLTSTKNCLQGKVQ